MTQVIVDGIRTGTVSLDNPSVRTLLETCASNGIGTAGLNTHPNSAANSHINHFFKHPVAEMAGVGGLGGGRKSPGAGGKKSPLPSPSSVGGGGAGSAGGSGGSGGKKKAAVEKTPVVVNAGNGNGNAKAPINTAAGSSAGASGAPTANGDAKKSGSGGGGGGKGAAKAEAASKGEVKSPKSPTINVVDKASPKASPAPKSSSSTPKSSSSTPKSSSSTPKSADKAGRATGGSKGKVGLAVPKTLFPELARLIHSGGEVNITAHEGFRGLYQNVGMIPLECDTAERLLVRTPPSCLSAVCRLSHLFVVLQTTEVLACRPNFYVFRFRGMRCLYVCARRLCLDRVCV